MDPIRRANLIISELEQKINDKEEMQYNGPVYIGVDIGTANVVTIAVDAHGRPLAGEITKAKVTREGMIVDYMGAVRIVKAQVAAIAERLGLKVSKFEPAPVLAMSAIPPATGGGNARVTANILESAELEVLGMVDEPEAAALVLGMPDGAIVDVGGGTTGISMLEDGKVVESWDEPTGGFHFDLVISGRFGIPIEEAEAMKLNVEEQPMLFAVVREVMRKVAAITTRCLRGYNAPKLYLVGGSCAFHGFCGLMEKETGIPTFIPENPLLATPLGIAIACAKQAGGAEFEMYEPEEPVVEPEPEAPAEDEATEAPAEETVEEAVKAVDEAIEAVEATEECIEDTEEPAAPAEEPVEVEE